MIYLQLSALILIDNVIDLCKKWVMIARPADIRFTEEMPKTRSGKIMRRLLRSLASGQEVTGDTSTLEDRSVLDKLREGA